MISAPTTTKKTVPNLASAADAPSLLRKVIGGLLTLGTTGGCLLPLIYFGPQYAPHVLVPIAGLALAEVLYRPPTKSFQDKTSTSSLKLLITGFVVQFVVASCHFADHKPLDIGISRERFPFTGWSRGLLLIQLLGSFQWLWSLRSLQGHFTANLEIIDGHRLITSGVYNYVRHPGYSSMLLTITSTCLSITRNAGLTGLVLFNMIVIYKQRIAEEEAMLLGEFGQDYLDYRNSTSDLLPFTGNILAPASVSACAKKKA